MYIYIHIWSHIHTLLCTHNRQSSHTHPYEMATISRLPKNISLFRKRAL